jgi:hypothetical protein
MHLERRIEVNTPIKRVWAANENIESWSQLSPSMAEVRRLDGGPLAIGSRARIKQLRFPAAEWTLTALDPGRALTWESRSIGVRTIATHELESTAAGTSLLFAVDLSGLPVRLLAPVISRIARRFVEQESQGFKSYCEWA